MRRSVILLPPLLLAGVALAHHPIVVPAAPWGKLEQELELTYAFGHPFEAELAPASRPARWSVFPPGQPEVDLLPTLGEDGPPERPTWRARYTPRVRGDHVVALTRPVSEHDGKQYQDFVKTVLHVPAVEAGWDRVLGDPLEVVPLTRPYGLPVGATFRAEVLADGEPLAHADVAVEYLNASPPETLPPEPFVTRVERTDRGGAFSATLDRTGWWILATSREAPEGVQRAALWVFVGPPG